MRVILDTDPGNGYPAADTDDGLALGLILESPELQLEAVTIVGGNMPVELGQRSALHMLELAGSGIPVHPGSVRPILEDAAAWRRELDGRRRTELAVELWNGIEEPRPRRRAAAEPAVQALVRLANAYPGELTIIAVGPLTNVAGAILLDPELPRKLDRIVIMGGSFGVWHSLQEMNFCYDPEAARIVVTSGARITLVPLDTTLKTFLTLSQNERLKHADRPLARYLGTTGEPWIRWVAGRDDRRGCALHDPLAVAALLLPPLVTVERVRVDVELAGQLTRGRPVSWHPDKARLSQGLRLHTFEPIEVAVDVDNDAFVEFLLDRLLA